MLHRLLTPLKATQRFHWRRRGQNSCLRHHAKTLFTANWISLVFRTHFACNATDKRLQAIFPVASSFTLSTWNSLQVFTIFLFLSVSKDNVATSLFTFLYIKYGFLWNSPLFIVCFGGQVQKNFTYIRFKNFLRNTITPGFLFQSLRSIECVRSCDQKPYLHNEKKKGGICIKIEFNPQKNITLLQDGRRFFVYSSNMVAVTSCEHTLQAGLECKAIHAALLMRILRPWTTQRLPIMLKDLRTLCKRKFTRIV